MEKQANNGQTVYQGSAEQAMNIALQTAIVNSYEVMIREGRTDLLHAWGEAYERLQAMKTGRTVMI